MEPVKFYQDRPFLLELFILFNLAFLTLDVSLAHAANAFHHRGEWLPVFFSALATLALAAGLRSTRGRLEGRYLRVGSVVGWGSILVGLLGLIWHLQSRFFVEVTLKSLVYSAPFAAPLAYTGLGFLLLLNRNVPTGTVDWGRWVLFFAWGGFIGNFALSLGDHAQNGFFYKAEWISVIGSALAVGFLAIPVFGEAARPFLRLCFGVAALEGLVGLVGFYLHVEANAVRAAGGLEDSFLFGAPIFAPLLFPNLALLAALGLWDLLTKQTAVAA